MMFNIRLLNKLSKKNPISYLIGFCFLYKGNRIKFFVFNTLQKLLNKHCKIIIKTLLQSLPLITGL
jgi:hypothetical protein